MSNHGKIARSGEPADDLARGRDPVLAAALRPFHFVAPATMHTTPHRWPNLSLPSRPSLRSACLAATLWTLAGYSAAGGAGWLASLFLPPR